MDFRLARAQKERDEMIEAKKRELSQQLAELEDDGTGSEHSYEGFTCIKYHTGL